MKKIGKEPSDENNEDNDDDLLSDINIGKEFSDRNLSKEFKCFI